MSKQINKLEFIKNNVTNIKGIEWIVWEYKNEMLSYCCFVYMHLFILFACYKPMQLMVRKAIILLIFEIKRGSR